jgi:hypothetical protein
MNNLGLESRIVRNETNINNIEQDVSEIKRNIWWIIGILFGFNGTIIGLLAKVMSQL